MASAMGFYKYGFSAKQIHASSSRYINTEDKTPARKVWFQYWDTHLTFQRSYLARLNYVMQNPVKHRLVDSANQYKWCSLNWFEKTATKSYYDTVTSIKTDSITIMDDF